MSQPRTCGCRLAMRERWLSDHRVCVGMGCNSLACSIGYSRVFGFGTDYLKQVVRRVMSRLGYVGVKTREDRLDYGLPSNIKVHQYQLNNPSRTETLNAAQTFTQWNLCLRYLLRNRVYNQQPPCSVNSKRRANREWKFRQNIHHAEIQSESNSYHT